ncbi:hypothetical protein L484_020199 [Morus notabilis]|uniref:DUF7477 domain-containing protein n=1 Tax=Morus notabilis TaxID=981085 RepID=W9RMI5_9ROSA|nr:hypothetical protein L484_020199 [Morus notabilis]
MSSLDDGQRARPTRKWISLVNPRDPKMNQTCDYDVKDRTRLFQMIARCKAEGFLIHSVESGSNIWDLIMDDATGFSEQVYKFSPHFLPDNWIEEQWENGFYITAIAGDDDGSSLVVMSRGTRFHDKQVYKVCESIPYKWMERKWKEGYSVTARASAGKKWAIVMSKGAGFSKLQVVEFDSNYPSKRIHERWDSGYDTTAMADTADQFAFARREPSTMIIRPR